MYLNVAKNGKNRESTKKKTSYLVLLHFSALKKEAMSIFIEANEIKNHQNMSIIFIRSDSFQDYFELCNRSIDLFWYHKVKLIYFTFIVALGYTTTNRINSIDIWLCCLPFLWVKSTILRKRYAYGSFLLLMRNILKTLITKKYTSNYSILS